MAVYACGKVSIMTTASQNGCGKTQAERYTHMELSVSIYAKDTQTAAFTAAKQLLSDSAQLPVILCIGSDKVTGDCLGPMVGHLLTRRHNVPAYVYGTMEFPVTAKNLAAALSFIHTVHRGARVLAIDAALGNAKDIGMLFFRRQGLYAGKAVGKEFPLAGDYSVTAVVNSGGENDGSKLFSTSMYTVIRLAEQLAAAISAACTEKRQLHAGAAV